MAVADMSSAEHDRRQRSTARAAQSSRRREQAAGGIPAVRPRGARGRPRRRRGARGRARVGRFGRGARPGLQKTALSRAVRVLHRPCGPPVFMPLPHGCWGTCARGPGNARPVRTPVRTSGFAHQGRSYGQIASASSTSSSRVNRASHQRRIAAVGTGGRLPYRQRRHRGSVPLRRCSRALRADSSRSPPHSLHRDRTEASTVRRMAAAAVPSRAARGAERELGAAARLETSELPGDRARRKSLPSSRRCTRAPDM